MDQYDLDFAHAMKVKLRLNREKSARASAEEEFLKKKQPEPDDDFRTSIARQVVEDNPGLTIEKVLEMMEFSGGVTFIPINHHLAGK